MVHPVQGNNPYQGSEAMQAFHFNHAVRTFSTTLEEVLTDPSLLNSDDYKSRLAEAIMNVGKESQAAKTLSIGDFSSSAHIVQGIITQPIENDGIQTSMLQAAEDFTSGKGSSQLDAVVGGCVEFPHATKNLIDELNFMYQGRI